MSQKPTDRKNPEDYAKLRELLNQQETFPVDFHLKFVGKNSEAFARGVTRFENEHPQLKETSRRLSAQANHLALSYVFSAKSADHIIAVLERAALIEDVQIVL